MLLDEEPWTEHDADLASTDPLQFTDTKPYAQRLKEAQKKLGMNDAIITAEGRLNGTHRDLLRDGIRVHRRLDGRGGRRKSHARD